MLAWNCLVRAPARLPCVLPGQWALPGVRLNFPILLAQRTKHLLPPPKLGPPRPRPWQQGDPWGGSQTHQARRSGEGAESRKVIHPICHPPLSRPVACGKGRVHCSGWSCQRGGSCRPSDWRWLGGNAPPGSLET